MLWLNWAGSAPCRDGGRLPLREGAPLEDVTWSELAMLRRSSLGECTDAVSGQEVTPVSGRWALTSDWPNPKFEKPALRPSIWREAKFALAASPNGFIDLDSEPLDEANSDDGLPSA